jgi:GMP synthase-like glutamine amidotransferase
MSETKILILDYSVDKIEAAAIKRWFPTDVHIKTLFIDTEESFPDNLKDQEFTHVIHSGSSLSINETAPFTKKAVKFIQDIQTAGVSQFGICYGHQLICLALVGEHAVRSSPNGLEVGWGNIEFNALAMKILGVGENEVVWQSHFDEVIAFPDGSELIATNSHTNIQAYINYEQKLIGTQFHPEFDKEAGDKLFLDDSALLERNNFNVDEIVSRNPTIDAGRIFFSYFLQNI